MFIFITAIAKSGVTHPGFLFSAPPMDTTCIARAGLDFLFLSLTALPLPISKTSPSAKRTRKCVGENYSFAAFARRRAMALYTAIAAIVAI